MFDPEGKLKKTEYFGQKYCKCVSPDDTFPHGSPEFNCELDAAMETCRKTRSPIGVFTANCVTEVTRKKRRAQRWKREVRKEDDEPVAFPMPDEEPLLSSEVDVTDNILL